MDKLWISTRNELEKMLRKRRSQALLWLSALLPLPLAWLAAALHQRLGIFTLGSGDFAIWILGLYCAFLLPLFLFLWTADSFSGEAADQSLRLALLRPVSRFKVYASKQLAIALMLLACLLLSLLAASLASWGFSLSESGWWGGLLRGLLAYSLAWLPLLALLAVAAALSQLFDSASTTLLVCILLYLAASVFPLLSPQWGSLTPVAYSHWHLLWLSDVKNWSQLLKALAVMLASVLLCFPAGLARFERRDF